MTKLLKLPYLCDRSEQRMDLQEALLQHQQLKPQRPFLFIVHGHEYECHTEFLEVVKEHELAIALGLDKKQISITEHILDWPLEASTKDIVKRLQQKVSSVVCNIVGKSHAEITEMLALHNTPVMLKVELLESAFNADFEKKLQAFIKFWNEWPNLPVGCVLMIVLLAKYRNNADFITHIKTLKLGHCKNLHAVRLPELLPVKESDVEAWKSRHTQLHSKHVRGLYANATDGIPMEILAEQLQALLHA